MVAKGTKRKVNEAEVATEKCVELAKVITAAADLPNDVISMLTDLLPHCLAQPQDKRHRFQEKAIQSVDRVMQGIEERLKKHVEEARCKLVQAQEHAAPSEQKITETEDKLRQDTERFGSETKVLANTALAFRAARTALEETRKAQITGDEDYFSATKRKAALHAIIDTLIEPLKLGSVPGDDIEKQCKTLLSALNELGDNDEAMMMVLGSSLSKKPEARGNFDVMAIEQLDKCMAKRVAPLDEILLAGEAGKQERASAVKSAQAALEEALQSQKQRSEIFEAAWNAKTEDEHTLQASHQALKDLAKQTKLCDTTLYKAEAEFEVFEEFARKSFEELKERITPEPVVEAEPVVEPEQSQAMDVVESATIGTNVVLPEAITA